MFLAAVFALSGCQMFQRSKAWELATSASEHIPGQGDWARSDEYARGLQKLLAENGVPNKRVTFRYTVNSRRGEEKSVTQSVVIYRDDLSPKYPWWLIDNLREAPTWLPNDSLDKQIQFARFERDFEIVAVHEAGGGAKEHEEESDAAAKESRDWKALFRQVHGTVYDANSPVDRRKMAALKARR